MRYRPTGRPRRSRPLRRRDRPPEVLVSVVSGPAPSSSSARAGGDVAPTVAAGTAFTTLGATGVTGTGATGATG